MCRYSFPHQANSNTVGQPIGNLQGKTHTAPITVISKIMIMIIWSHSNNWSDSEVILATQTFSHLNCGAWTVWDWSAEVEAGNRHSFINIMKF